MRIGRSVGPQESTHKAELEMKAYGNSQQLCEPHPVDAR